MKTGKMSLPRQISSEFLHRDTKVEALLDRHRAKLAARSKANGITHRLMRSYDENLAMQNRMNALKAAYRGEIGGITRQGLDNIAPQRAELNAEVHQEIENIRNERS